MTFRDQIRSAVLSLIADAVTNQAKQPAPATRRSTKAVPRRQQVRPAAKASAAKSRSKAAPGANATEPLCDGASLFAGVNKAGRPYAGLRFGQEFGASCVVRRRHLAVWKRLLAPKAYATLEAFVDLYGG